MRIRSYCILALLFSSLIFNGCFEIFYDVVQNPNGTFVIRETIGFGAQFFQDLADFGAIGDSTSKATPQTIIDSMRHTFVLRRDSLIQIQHIIGMSGITAFSVHDTSIDTMTYFSMEAVVENADSLPGALHLISSTSDAIGPGAKPADSDDVRLKVTHSKERAVFMFYAPPKAGGFMHIDIPGLEESFKNLSLHYRVFSSTLERPRDKQIKQIPGGQERVFGLKDLLQKGRHAHLDASFAIKNPANRD